MSKFTEGTRVLIIVDNQLKRGTIRYIYEDIGIATVAFDDGEIGKVSIADLALSYDEERREEPKAPTEPVEKSEITITPDEFKKIASKIISKSTGKIGEGGGLLVLSFTILVSQIHRALFYDEGDND